GRLHVVGEDQEPGAKAADFGQRDPIQDRAHRMLADAEMQVAAARAIRFEIAGAFEREVRFRRWVKIGGAADQPGIARGDGIEDLARRVAGGHSFLVGSKRNEAAVPAVWELALLHALDLVGELRILCSIRLEQRHPSLADVATAPAYAVVKML